MHDQSLGNWLYTEINQCRKQTIHRNTEITVILTYGFDCLQGSLRVGSDAKSIRRLRYDLIISFCPMYERKHKTCNARPASASDI